MKRFKQIEFFLSSALIVGFLLLGFVSGNIDWLLTAYFTIGAIHVFGMFVHAYNSWFTGNGSPRSYYHWLILILFALILVNGLGLFLLLYAAPFLAIIYTIICWFEVRALQLKEFVHLK